MSATIELRRLAIPLVRPFRTSKGVETVRDVLIASWTDADGVTGWAESAADPEPTYYGYGWRVADGRQWHNGESIGFRNSYVRWPEQGLSVILLSNRNDPTPYPTAVQIGELILRERGVADP